jgi:hypothetical protein
MNAPHAPGSQPLFEEIRTLAYFLWQEADALPGRELEFWLRAEQQVTARLSAPETARPDGASHSTQPEPAPPPKSKPASPRAAAPKPAVGTSGRPAPKRRPAARASAAKGRRSS